MAVCFSILWGDPVDQPSPNLWWWPVICYSLLVKMAIEVVDLPIENGGSFQFVFCSLPEGIFLAFIVARKVKGMWDMDMFTFTFTLVTLHLGTESAGSAGVGFLAKIPPAPRPEMNPHWLVNFQVRVLCVDVFGWSNSTFITVKSSFLLVNFWFSDWFNHHFWMIKPSLFLLKAQMPVDFHSPTGHLRMQDHRGHATGGGHE